ncbi:MAG: hypothetical protein U9N86_03120 [Bacteroidota bacterium]|nr:hypothetical protein [Bacteroidota bacterium]
MYVIAMYDVGEKRVGNMLKHTFNRTIVELKLSLEGSDHSFID